MTKTKYAILTILPLIALAPFLQLQIVNAQIIQIMETILTAVHQTTLYVK